VLLTYLLQRHLLEALQLLHLSNQVGQARRGADDATPMLCLNIPKKHSNRSSASDPYISPDLLLCQPRFHCVPAQAVLGGGGASPFK